MATLRDAIYGQAVGDALGVPWEFLTRGSFTCEGMVGYGSHNQPAGTWSDDTSLALATCDSIRRRGRVDVESIRMAFEAWLEEGAYTVDDRVFDVGGTTFRAIQQGRGCDGEFDNGNGSLMRIAPLAFTDATDDMVRRVSAITHAHPISCQCCVDFIHGLRDAANRPDYMRNKLVGELRGFPQDQISSGGYVADTLEAACWAFANTDNFRDCVLLAVNLGDDSDTTGAVAGALAGTYYGMDTIPAEWLDELRGKDVIEACLF